MRKMKRIALIAAVVLAILFLGSCTVWQMFFGPDKNSIDAWWPKDFKIGTQLTYRYYETTTDGTADNTYTREITDVDDRESKIVVKTNGSLSEYYTGMPIFPLYFIIDKDGGDLLFSFDEYIDNDDMILLETPIEEGTIWYLTGDGENVKFTIDQVKQTRTVGNETYDDVVVVKTSGYGDYDGYLVSMKFYLSATAGYLGYVMKWNSDTTGGLIETGFELTNIDKP